MARRGTALNKQPTWAADPVVAKARVLDPRQIVDRQQRREVCVNADPMDTPPGFCATHAGVLRAFPPLDPKQPMEWAMLREKLSDCFAEVAHCSGKAVEPPAV